MSFEKRLFSETPLIESLAIGKVIGLPTFLKLENTHPTGCYKLRGLSLLCQQAVREGHKKVVTASGGNAGLAVAYSARHLGIEATVVVPSTTSLASKNHLVEEGATIEVHGNCYDEANIRAREIAKTSDGYYIHPFDHPTVWEGHSTMVEEIKRQLDCKPSAIVTCVGGGGMACGLLRGMPKIGWEDVPLVAMETVGADCFNQSIKANKKVTLSEITSIAVCLGSLEVCDKLMEYVFKKRPILSEVVTDREAADACLKFANDHRILVEIACGATMAAAYSGIITRFVKEGKIRDSGPVVFIVCGGGGVNLEILEGLKKDFDL